MHVHLPKPLHGWREFAGEVGVIVLGVLIAMIAEQVVEELSWRAKIAKAEQAMRIELAEDNAPQAYGRALIGRCLNQQITQIHNEAGVVPTAQLRRWISAYQPPVRTWDSEAWKAVLGSDVGSHMGAVRLVAWSSPYRMMPMLSEANGHERELVMQLRESLPPTGEASGSDLQKVRSITALLWAQNSMFTGVSQLLLSRSEQNGAHISNAAKQDLLKRARLIYGDCIEVPTLKGPAAEGVDANLIRPIEGLR
jgi:hypothetical protein